MPNIVSNHVMFKEIHDWMNCSAYMIHDYSPFSASQHIMLGCIAMQLFFQCDMSSLVQSVKCLYVHVDWSGYRVG